MTEFQKLVEQIGRSEGLKFFDRANLFTIDDMRTVRDLIELQYEIPYQLDDVFEFTNQCYGLYDGFLYNDGELILNQLQKLGGFDDAIALIEKIKNNIL